MKRNFDLSISYQGREISVAVQFLTSEDEYPIIFAVWPKDEFLKKEFDDTFVTFAVTSKPNKDTPPTIWHKVHYSKEVKSKNLEFEIAVWAELLWVEGV